MKNGEKKISFNVSNPYDIRGMMPIESDMFFGRKRDIRRIIDLLSRSDTPQSVSIIGERRIGKSSLAFKIFYKLKESQNTIAFYLDCDGLSEKCNTKDLFFQFLNERLLEALENKPEIVELFGKIEKNLFDNYSSFMTFVRNESRKGINFIIFLDEFEHLLKNKFADDIFFSNLRATANDAENRLAFVTISKKPLDEFLHQAIQSSAFWNIFETEFIGLLDHDSIERLRKYGFKKNNLPLIEKEIERIHYYAGDFPFFNQMTCSFLWNSKVHMDTMEWEKLEAKLFPYFRKLWNDRTKEEQKLLKSLKSKKDDIGLNEMENRGIVIKKENFYFPFSGYFSHLIDKNLVVKREKISEKEIVQDIKEGLDMLKKGRDVLKGD